MSKKQRSKKKASRQRSESPKFPLATIAFYGPDDKMATKIAVGIIMEEGAEPAFMKRWHSAGTDIRSLQHVNVEIFDFIRSHNVSSVVTIERIIGCPHEEGIDYPEGEVCPHCPFWAYRDQWTGEIVH